MKKYIITIIVFLIYSCKSNYLKEYRYYENNSKDLWISSFKYEVFYECIRQGIGNDSLRIILSEKDLFNKSLELDFNTIDNARNIGSLLIKNMPKPYIKVDNETKEKNFISFECLKYYSSKELDKIANDEYNKLNMNKLD